MKTKQVYPIQLRVDPRLVKLCTEESKKLPGCPRPNAGSFSWFVKVAVSEKLKKQFKNHSYIDDVLPIG